MVQSRINATPSNGQGYLVDKNNRGVGAGKNNAQSATLNIDEKTSIEPVANQKPASPPPLAPMPSQQTQQPVQNPQGQSVHDQAQQQQQFAQAQAYRQQQMYYAQQQQQYLMQQRQAAYYQMQQRQRMQQQQAMQYYQQIGQHYGYPAMQQAMNQNMFLQHQQQQHSAQQHAIYDRQTPTSTNTHSNQNVSVSEMRGDEQPLLSEMGGSASVRAQSSAPQRAPRKGRKRRREDQESDDEDIDDLCTHNAKVSIEVDDDDADTVGLDKDGYDRATFVNSQEVLPSIDNEFADWLAFSKKLWRRQKKYKNVFAAEDARKSCLDDSISPSNDSPISSPSKSIIFKSAFMNGLE